MFYWTCAKFPAQGVIDTFNFDLDIAHAIKKGKFIVDFVLALV